MPTPSFISASIPALEQALADAIAKAKADDPLAKVTILVGGTLQRPYLQRRLATLLGGHANVACVTAGELALQLGEPALVAQGRLPMPPLAARILAGEVARDTGGYFAPVAHTTGFTTVLHRLFRELAQAGIDASAFEAAVDKLPGTAAKHTALAELLAGHEARRAGWYGVDECLATVDPERLDSELLVVHGLWDLNEGLARALASIAETVPTLVLLPVAADVVSRDGLATLTDWCVRVGAEPLEPPPDERAPTLLRHVQTAVFESPPPAPPQPDGSLELVSAPDPTREVRSAARACLAWAAQGIPFHRMAIASRHAEIYRPLVDTVFREAQIPVYLHEGTPLGELPLGRRILALLDLVDANLERRAVMDVLSDAALPNETRERYDGFSPTRWDTLSRTAGIVGGIDQWRARLTEARAEREARIAADATDAPAWLVDEIARIKALEDFIADLGDALVDRPLETSFGEHLEWLERLLTTYVRDVEPVLVALRSLSRLDGITSSLSFDRFRDIVRAAIEGMRSDDILDRRVGAFGRRGVNVLDVNSLRSLRFDAVILLGLVERSWPSPVRQDALLLDRERSALSDATGRHVPLRALGNDAEPLQFAVALQAADRHLIASYPRADRAGGRAQLPSSFLRALATTATGETVSAEGFDHVGVPLVRRERAAQVGAPVGHPALSAVERKRSLLEDPDRGAVGRALLRRDPRFKRAAKVDRARGSRKLTVFDGVLAPDGVRQLQDHWSLRRPMPPTALETYATCGMQFFLGRVLGIRDVEEPEAILTIDPLTKGSVVHETLERFLVKLGDDDWPRPNRRAKHLKNLLKIGNEECDRAEARGMTGYSMLWEHERRRILEDLERWYDIEAARERDLPRRSYELRIGPLRRDEDDPNPLSVDEPLELAVGEGTLRIQGRIDRVEWDPKTGRFRIIDYKTGRVWTRSGDIKGGESLQLPLYVRAAAHALNLDPARGDGEYFYVTRDGTFERVTFTRDDLDDQGGWLDKVLGTLVGSITGGVFPARPADARVCERCTFDALCDGRRTAQRDRKSRDRRAVALDALREGPT